MLEAFESAWRLQDHRKKDNLKQEIDSLLTAIEREQHRGRVVVSVLIAYTVLVTVMMVILHLGRQTPLNELLPALGSLIAAFAGLVWIWRSRFSRRESYSRSGESLRASLQSALREIEGRTKMMRTVGVIVGVALLLIAGSVLQLWDSGKMDDRSVTSFSVVMAAVLIGNLVVLKLKLRRLAPRRARLQAILEEIESGA